MSQSKLQNSSVVKIQSHTGSPVLWWASVGLVVLVSIIAAYGQWILGPHFKPAPTGADPIPSDTLILIRSLEVILPLLMVFFYWKYLIKPWREAGHITWDGIFLLACATIWFQDPIDNYFNFTFAYNAHFFNMQSWAIYIPGWESPRQEHFAEPVFFMGAMFMWLFFGAAIFGCLFLNNAKRWWPNMGMPTQFFLLFLCFFAADLIAEVFLVRTTLFGYPGTYHALSLWAGTPYQFPLYEPTGIASVCIAMTAIRYYRDDKGQSFMEKGLDRLNLKRRTKGLLTFLSLLAGIHIFTWITFFLPYTWFALKADSFPEMPSYLLMEICGEGTPYACPSREVPIPSRESLAVPPDDMRLSPDARKN